MNNGYIKMHRKFTQWEWYQNSQAVHMFIHLLLDANHTEKQWQGYDVKRGQLITSISHISIATGISQQSVRTLMKKFEKSGEIIVKSTNRFTLVTICKYEDYQSNEAPNQQTTNNQLTNNQQSTNKQLTTNNNVKNVKKEKNNTDIPALEDFVSYGIQCASEANMAGDFTFSLTAKYQTWVGDGWKNGYGKQIKDWRRAIKNTIAHMKPTGSPQGHSPIHPGKDWIVYDMFDGRLNRIASCYTEEEANERVKEELRDSPYPRDEKEFKVQYKPNHLTIC